MPLSDINFQVAQGGLGAQAPGTDYYSGLVLYVTETKATASYLVTNAGATNDTVLVKVLQATEDGPELVTIGSYTRQSGDTTATLVATGIKNAINAGGTGYTATSSTATVTITAAPGQGEYLNTGSPLSVVISGTVAGTITQFSGGALPLPDGFSLFERIKPVYQIEDAENIGILDDYNDETKASATYQVTNAGATGDTVDITVTEVGGKVITIGSYTRTSGATTAALVASGIQTAINDLTSTTGYSADVSTDTITIHARSGMGIFLNSGSPITVSIVGTVAGTLTQFSGGVASIQAVWHYHIKWFFEKQTSKQGVLYVYIATKPSGTPDFEEIKTLQIFTNGQLKQIGVNVDFTAYSSSHFATIQSVCQDLDALHMPVSAVYAADMSATTISQITLDLGTLTDDNLSVAIGQDGAADGYNLYKTTGKSIGTIGPLLGTIAAAAVSQSVAEVGAFNVSDGVEFDTAAFATGELLRSISNTIQDQLNDKGYIFLRKFMGTQITTGTYFNSSRTAISTTNDYCFIERKRTVNKAKRVVRDSLLPLLSSRIPLNSNGTLTTPTIANFEAKAGSALNRMSTDGDISAYQVIIDPTQNILQTNILYITIKIVPVGVAKEIIVKIGYVPKLT